MEVLFVIACIARQGPAAKNAWGEGEHTTEAHATIKRKKSVTDMNLENKMLDIETPCSTILIHLFPEKTFLMAVSGWVGMGSTTVKIKDKMSFLQLSDTDGCGTW